MAVGLVLVVDNDQVLGGLRRMQAAAADLRPALEDIGAELESSTLLRFETNIAPDGSPWMPSLRGRETDTPTLVESGHLRDSIHYALDGDAVEVGSNLIYSGVHQVGATITAKGGGSLGFMLFSGDFVTVKSVTIPARPYLGMSAEDDANVVDIIGEHLARAAVRVS